MLNLGNEYKKYKKLRSALEWIAIALSYTIACISVNLSGISNEKIFSLGTLLFITICIVSEFIFKFLITKFIKYLVNHNKEN